MSGLRARRHAETRQAIMAAAFGLFERHGFNTTTMEQIADAAGVSRSTLYRRYANKEEIVLVVPGQWLDAWDAAIGALDTDISLEEAMLAGSKAVAANIDGNRDQVLAAYRALSESPSLQASGAATTDWLNRMADLVESRSPAIDQFEARVIAGACMGAIDAMMMNWASSGGEDTVTALTIRVFDRLAPILRANR